nr:hypothetical protein [Bordetella pertussis]
MSDAQAEWAAHICPDAGAALAALPPACRIVYLADGQAPALGRAVRALAADLVVGLSLDYPPGWTHASAARRRRTPSWKTPCWRGWPGGAASRWRIIAASPWCGKPGRARLRPAPPICPVCVSTGTGYAWTPAAQGRARARPLGVNCQ